MTLTASPITLRTRKWACDWAATWAIRYIMVHRDKLPPATEEALRQLLPVTLVGESGNLALYRLPDELALLMRFPSGRMPGAWCWPKGGARPDSVPRSTHSEAEARLLLPLGPEARQLRLDMWALAPKQSVTLIVDGRLVAPQPLSTERSLLTFDLPPDPARPPLSDVRCVLRRSLLWPRQQEPRWATKPTGIPGVSSLVVRSAGQETGDFAHVYADGSDLSPNRRGYNLAAWSPDDGRLLGARGVRYARRSGCVSAAGGLGRGATAGTVVAGAVRDEASLNLEAVASRCPALAGRRHRSAQPLPLGHAFIGAAGVTLAGSRAGERLGRRSGRGRPVDHLAAGRRGARRGSDRQITQLRFRAACDIMTAEVRSPSSAYGWGVG